VCFYEQTDLLPPKKKKNSNNSETNPVLFVSLTTKTPLPFLLQRPISLVEWFLSATIPTPTITTTQLIMIIRRGFEIIHDDLVSVVVVTLTNTTLMMCPSSLTGGECCESIISIRVHRWGGVWHSSAMKIRMMCDGRSIHHATHRFHGCRCCFETVHVVVIVVVVATMNRIARSRCRRNITTTSTHTSTTLK